MKNTQNQVLALLRNPSASIRSKQQAKQLHAQVIKLKPSYFPLHLSTIISIYSDLDLLSESILLFRTAFPPPPPAPAFKSIIRSYSSHGLALHAIQCFGQMKASGKTPDRSVFPAVLRSCAEATLDFRLGEAVHGCVVRSGMDFDLHTGNALMNMYAKFDAGKLFDKIPAKMPNVSKVFDTMPERDIVSWNTVIAGNMQNGLYDEALTMVREMWNANLKPDSYTLSSVLPIFAEHVNVDKGREIHGYVMRHGLDENVCVGSGLVDMYAKCSRVEDSLKVFHMLPTLDSVSWNSLIAGCVQNAHFDEGLLVFRRMLMAKVKPLEISFSSILPACSYLTTLQLGKQLHGYIVRVGFDGNLFISSSLVDMYAKCGNIKVARRIFDIMDQHDIVSRTAMIMAYAVHGHAHEAISLFEQMLLDGVRPNEVSFTAVLTACSHGGLIDEAWAYFSGMTREYDIAPSLEHYAAMADLLGRAGRLDEAYKLVSGVRGSTGAVWSALLSACRVHKNFELAGKVAEHIFEVDPVNIGAHVLLANVYAAARRWKDVAHVRSLMRSACSWIEVKNKLHAFVAGDESLPFYNQINEALTAVLEKMEQEGYVPDTSEVLQDVGEEQKKDMVFHHSENLP